MQKCMINELDYCEHDNTRITITECEHDSNCCHYCDSWYETVVDTCPVCSFTIKKESSESSRTDSPQPL